MRTPVSPSRLAIVLAAALNVPLASAQVVGPRAVVAEAGAARLAPPVSAPLAAVPAAMPAALTPSALAPAVSAAPAPAAAAPAAELGRISREVGRALEAAGPISRVSGEAAGALGGRVQQLLTGESPVTSAAAAEGPEPVSAGAGAEQTPEQKVMLRTLKQIVTLFTEHYAPIDWKQKQMGVDYKAEYEKIRAKVLAEPAMKQRDFQKLLAGFIAATRDYHAGIAFHSTERASLPLTILNAEGRYYIASIDRDALPANKFPFKEGDEIVEFGGRPTAQVAAALTLVPNTKETDARLADLDLTHRSRRSGADVPTGDVALKIRTADGTLKDATLAWDYSPEVIPTDVPVREGGVGPESALGADGGGAGSAVHDAARETIRHLMPPMAHPETAQFLARAAASPEADEGFMIAGKTSFVPALGEVVWQLPKKLADQIPFTAYIYKDAQGRRIGYIRVPDYEGGDKAPAIFASLISKFEKDTDALVVDQVNNPGGSVFYMYSLLSMLTDKPLAVPQHRLLIDESDAAWAAQALEQAQDPRLGKILVEQFNAEEGGDQDSGGPGISQLVAYARFILSELKAGRRLTNPVHLFGVAQIPPAKVHYSKPVFALTNELDFSAADFLPAILQDNKRATIFGVRTAGAGGAVKSVEPPNQSGVAHVSYTWTIAQRLNGQPVENLGVTPDVGYAITADDLRAGFAGYKKALLEAIAARVPPPAPGTVKNAGPKGPNKPASRKRKTGGE